MVQKKGNIFTFHDDLIPREAKEDLLNQRALTLWFTGLSGSGKTTIARLLEQKLHDERFVTMLLDGDNVRDGINNNLDFSQAGRSENIRRIAEVNKLFNACGIITLNCFVSPTLEMRAKARAIVGASSFFEIYVNTPLEVCEERDVKGLYARARAGEITDFTGISAPYEPPVAPEAEINTAHQTPEESANELLQFILPLIQKK